MSLSMTKSLSPFYNSITKNYWSSKKVVLFLITIVYNLVKMYYNGHGLYVLNLQGLFFIPATCQSSSIMPFLTFPAKRVTSYNIHLY